MKKTDEKVEMTLKDTNILGIIQESFKGEALSPVLIGWFLIAVYGSGPFEILCPF